jgi:hypothetical protein
MDNHEKYDTLTTVSKLVINAKMNLMSGKADEYQKNIDMALRGLEFLKQDIKQSVTMVTP